MPQAYLICGTGTNVGKSIVCAGLLKNLPHAQAIKIVQTGAELFDQNIYSAACPQNRVKTLRHFSLPASPHLAAAKQNQSISLMPLAQEIQKELEACEAKELGEVEELGELRELPERGEVGELPERAKRAEQVSRANRANRANRVKKASLTLLEGSGGIMTPLSASHTFLDLMVVLGHPVILVINNVLGAINQALLNIEVLKNRNLQLEGLIFTHADANCTETHPIAIDNIKSILEHCPTKLLGVVPHIHELAHADTEQVGWGKVASSLARTPNCLGKPGERQG